MLYMHYMYTVFKKLRVFCKITKNVTFLELKNQNIVCFTFFKAQICVILENAYNPQFAWGLNACIA